MIFISLEGIDGSGKTTIAKIVKDKLVQKGFDVLLTREPGGEPISEKIRELVLDPENSEMTAWTEALLYIASRKQHLDQVAIPDITLFFDISPEEAKVRLDLRNSGSDRLEAEADEFHEKVYQGYRMLISENSNRIKVIDARKAVDVISRQAIYLIEELLEERKASQ
jgi:dTMP kinase